MTTAGPRSGDAPARSSAASASAAVSPAVPSAIAVRASRPSGSGTSQSPGTRMSWPNPPGVFIPRSKPVHSTRPPTAKRASRDAITSPAASIPGVCG